MSNRVWTFGDGPAGLFGKGESEAEHKRKKKRKKRVILGGGPVAGPVFTGFARDTFTDTAGTNITAHNPEVGGPITEHPGDAVGDVLISAGGTAYESLVGVKTVKFMYAAVPPSADHYVQAKYIMLTDPSPDVDSMGVLARLDPVATTAYNIWWSGTNRRWELYRTVAGVDAMLASSLVNLLAVATPRVVRLEVRTVGATVELTGYSDDAILFGGTIVDAAGNRITAAGRVGYRFYAPAAAPTGTTRLHVDDFEAGVL